MFFPIVYFLSLWVGFFASANNDAKARRRLWPTFDSGAHADATRVGKTTQKKDHKRRVVHAKVMDIITSHYHASWLMITFLSTLLSFCFLSSRHLVQWWSKMRSIKSLPF